MLAGRYVLEQELGRSGFGVAWRATDVVLDRRVVVKLLRPELADDPGFAERLAERLRAVALVSHPGLARLLDTGREDGVEFIVREYVEGRSLRDVLDSKGDMPVERAASVIRSVLEVLAASHDVGVLHLDLKPENVLIGPDGAVRVCDPGIAQAVVGTTPSEKAAGIPGDGPLPPEQRTGGPVGPRTDVWGAGALLFELLTGQPFQDGRPVTTRSLRRNTPRGLDAVVARALSPDPEDRFASTHEFAESLGRISGEGEGPPLGGAVVRPARRAAAPPSNGHRSVFRTWLAVPLLIALVAAGSMGAGLWLGELELGGPVGIRVKREEVPSSTPAARLARFASVGAFDPFGDGSENDSGLAFAADGDAATVWKSENYFDGRLNKPGVGLLFDLGVERTVTGFRLSTPYPGFEFGVVVGDDPATMADAARATFTASAATRESIESATGRYVLLWITTVVSTGDGNRAEVAEFRVVATD